MEIRTQGYSTELFPIATRLPATDICKDVILLLFTQINKHIQDMKRDPPSQVDAGPIFYDRVLFSNFINFYLEIQ